MKIGMFGRGRLASAIATLGGEKISWKIGRNEAPPSAVDVAIDASMGDAAQAHLTWALENNVDLVIGTTGWSIPDLKEQVGERIGVVVAPNFSISIALFARLSLVMARFAALDAGRDPYIVEHHHARKKDAPSGTAKLLAKTIMKGCPRKTEWTLQGPGDLKEHQLSVSSIRAGHTYSSHIVGIDAPAETLELHHASRSPMAYADGALRVSEWIHGRKGIFTMDQFSEETLDPLFQEVKP
ncbi:MAG: dihydrodipicolinate reductase C-terminal domain-containing protein [Vicinamibacteria bacterium]